MPGRGRVRPSRLFAPHFDTRATHTLRKESCQSPVEPLDLAQTGSLRGHRHGRPAYPEAFGDISLTQAFDEHQAADFALSWGQVAEQDRKERRHVSEEGIGPSIPGYHDELIPLGLRSGDRLARDEERGPRPLRRRPAA